MITDLYFSEFALKLHIFHQFDYTVHVVFACRRCDKPDNVQFMKSAEKYVASFDVFKVKRPIGLRDVLMIRHYHCFI